MGNRDIKKEDKKVEEKVIIMERQEFEKEISLRELFWQIVMAWRFWIISGIIFAVLISGMHYVKGMKTYHAEVAQQKAAEELTEEVEASSSTDFTKDELQQIQDAKSIKKAMEKSRKYLKNSVLMNIDPYQEKALVMQYYIDSDYSWNINENIESDYTTAVTAAYAEYIKSGAITSEIKNELGLDLDEKYIEELISVDDLEAEIKSNSILSVQVVYTDEETLKEMAAVVENCIEGQTSVISDTVGSHRLKLLSENVITQTDSDLASKQSVAQTQLSDYRYQLNVLTNAMSEEQLSELDITVAADTLEEGEEADTEVVVQAPPTKPSFSMKYLILGFVVGVFFVVLWVCAKVVFSSTLQNSEELSDLYGVRLLGCIRKEEKVSKVDEFLLNLKNRKRKKISREASENILVSNLELACRAENIQKIFLTGTEIEHVEKAWITAFTEKMQNVGIEVVYGENVCYSAAALREAVEIGTAVLIEQSGQSIYDEISGEIKMLKEQNVRILGGICL